MARRPAQGGSLQGKEHSDWEPGPGLGVAGAGAGVPRVLAGWRVQRMLLLCNHSVGSGRLAAWKAVPVFTTVLGSLALTVPRSKVFLAQETCSLGEASILGPEAAPGVVWMCCPQ